MISQHIGNLATPPTSPEQVPEPDVKRAATMKKLGRKKKKRDRAQAYRQIFKLKISLKSEMRLKEKYKKRCTRMLNKVAGDTEKETQFVSNHDMRKALLFYSTIIKTVRKRYKTCKSYKKRRLISSLVCSYGLVTKYRLGRYVRKTIGLSHHMMRPKKKGQCQSRSTRMKISVCSFLERDDNSRIKADKKATITRKGEKRQIRLLSDDLKHLHAKLISEGKVKVSYSLFCKLKPFWIVKPTERARDTCLCKLHENLAMKIERAYNENVYNTKNVDELVKTMTCSDSNKECMYRECGVCREKKAPRNEFGEEKQVTWPMWKNRRIEKTKKNPAGESITKMVQITVKEDETGTLTTLADAIDNELERAARHIFNIRHQYTALRYLREHLTNEDVVLHIDFSDNYNCKYKSEIQSVHFGASQRQISLHTGVAYTKESTYPFTTMSDCLKHSPAAIWAHLDPVIDFLKSESDVNTIHFISDGPTTQYRNKQNFYLFSTRIIYDKGFRGGTWNFLEAWHGKGASDGIGAAIKRLADKVVQRRGQDITCAQDLLNGVDATDTKVKMFLVEESDISRLESALPSKLVVVKDTMNIHQHQDIAVGASGDGPTCPPLKAVDVIPSLHRVVGPTEGQTIVAGPTEGQTTVVGPTEGQTIVAGPTEGQTIVAGPRACIQWTDQGPVDSGPTEGQSTVPVIEPSDVVGPSEGQTTVVGPTEGQTILVGPRASLQLTDQGLSRVDRPRASIQCQ